jgi:hypothetical protein
MQVRVLYICFNEVSHQLLSWLLLAMFSSQLLAVTKAALYLQHKQQARQPERGPPSSSRGGGVVRGHDDPEGCTSRAERQENT